MSDDNGDEAGRSGRFLQGRDAPDDLSLSPCSDQEEDDGLSDAEDEDEGTSQGLSPSPGAAVEVGDDALGEADEEDKEMAREVLRKLAAVKGPVESAIEAEQNVARLKWLELEARSGRLRDLEDARLFLDPEFYRGLAGILPSAWETTRADEDAAREASKASKAAFGGASQAVLRVVMPVLPGGSSSNKQAPGAAEPEKKLPERVSVAYAALISIMRLPEVKEHVAASKFARVLDGVARLRTCAAAERRPLLRALHVVYERFVSLRVAIRTHLVSELRGYLQNPSCVDGVSELLSLLAAILRGLRVPMDPDMVETLLWQAAMPLHVPSATLEDQTSALSAFHEQLVFVLSQFVERDLALLPAILTRVEASWPAPVEASSRKELLLLHEMDALIDRASAAEPLSAALCEQCATPLLRAVSRAAASDHHLVAQKALGLFRSPALVALVGKTDTTRDFLFRSMFCALLSEPSWNPTVNRLRASVLEVLEQIDPGRFAASSSVQWEILIAAGAEWALRPGLSPDASTPEVAAATTRRWMRSVQPSPEEEAELERRVHHPPVDEQGVPMPIEHLTYQSFVFGHVLGRGAFSTVFYAKRINRLVPSARWTEYAIKVLAKAVLKKQEYEENVDREMRILHELAHPFITRLVAVCESPERVYLVLEYAARGDLHTHISTLGSLSRASAQFLAAELVSALDYLRTKGIVYGDLKPENVLLHDSGHAKLTDFGSARFENEIRDGGRLEGTLEYLAPEVVRGGRASHASDLWALGCVIFHALAGRPPVWAEEDEPAAARQEVISKIVRFGGDGSASAEKDDRFPAAFPADARDLVERLLSPDPSSRPSGEALKAHPFFAGIDFGTLYRTNPPPLARGSSAPQPEKKWARRRNSVMLSPDIEQYSFAGEGFALEPVEQDPREKKLALFVPDIRKLEPLPMHAPSQLPRPRAAGGAAGAGPLRLSGPDRFKSVGAHAQGVSSRAAGPPAGAGGQFPG